MVHDEVTITVSDEVFDEGRKSLKFLDGRYE